MQAVADSNLAAMAGIWGTRQGPGGAHASSRPTTSGASRSCRAISRTTTSASSPTPPTAPSGRHAVQVQIRRAGLHLVPFRSASSSSRDGSWIVNQIDLDRGRESGPALQSLGAQDTARTGQ